MQRFDARCLSVNRRRAVCPQCGQKVNGLRVYFLETTGWVRSSGSAIPNIKKEGTLRRRSGHRPVQYLNNFLEQGHRVIKRRVNAKQVFREFQAARRTIQGYEAMNMVVLQLFCSRPARNVKNCCNGYATDDLQVAPNSTGAHSLCGALVSSIFAVIAGCRGTAGGTRLQRVGPGFIVAGRHGNCHLACSL